MDIKNILKQKQNKNKRSGFGWVKKCSPTEFRQRADLSDVLIYNASFLNKEIEHLMGNNFPPISVSRLGMSVTTQGGSGRQFVTGP